MSGIIKYFKHLDSNVVRAFDEGVRVDDYINLAEWELMGDDDIEHHLYPEKYISEHEQELLKRQQMPSLTKRQFNFYLRDIGLLAQVKQMLAQDLDVQLEYESVFEIYRDSPTVTNMIQVLNLTEEQVDEMWIEALKL